MCGILHYVLDDEDPEGLTGALYDALPRGSYVFIHHLLDTEDPATATLQEQMRAGVGRAQFRTMARIKELFDFDGCGILIERGIRLSQPSNFCRLGAMPLIGHPV